MTDEGATLEAIKGGNLMFIQALAATIYQMDVKPQAPWTATSFRTYLRATLNDVYINQDVPKRYYDQTQRILVLLDDQIAGFSDTPHP